MCDTRQCIARFGTFWTVPDIVGWNPVAIRPGRSIRAIKDVLLRVADSFTPNHCPRQPLACRGPTAPNMLPA